MLASFLSMVCFPDMSVLIIHQNYLYVGQKAIFSDKFDLVRELNEEESANGADCLLFRIRMMS